MPHTIHGDYGAAAAASECHHNAVTTSVHLAGTLTKVKQTLSDGTR